MDTCTTRIWVMAGLALAFAAYVIWTARYSYRSVAAKYAEQWGVDAAMVSVVRGRRGGSLSAALTWLVLSPVLLLIMAVPVYAVTTIVPAFRACAEPLPFYPTMAAGLTAIAFALPFMIAGMMFAVAVTPDAVVYRKDLARLRREDLPERPTPADFEAAVPRNPAFARRIRLISLVVCAVAVAVIVYLVTSDAADVIFDFIIPHRATPERMAVIVRGSGRVLPWFQWGIMVCMGALLVWTLSKSRRRQP